MKDKIKKFYITTPIYYPSGQLHIGHVYTTTLAQSIVNYKKMQGYKTFFLTGSDEHGEKIEKKAKENKLEPQDYVDKMIISFKNLWNKLDIKYDYFIRTTDKNHIKTVKEVFQKLQDKNLIYKGYYEGLYSIHDEEFFTKSQAIKKDGKYYAPLSNHELKIIKEPTYFLKAHLSKEWLKKIILNSNFVTPKKVALELDKNFLNNLEDLSITRTSFNWGIKLENDKDHTIYVWFDALINYISALGYKDSTTFNEFWMDDKTEIVHIIGKEITRFHCIYWPIILNGLDLRLPNNILAHGWIVTPTGKMSKSKNNVVHPEKIIDKYGPEILQYFLMSQIKTGSDGIFSIELLESTYNTELVNIYGNLVSRTLAMISQNFKSLYENSPSTINYDVEMTQSILDSKKKFMSQLDNYILSSGIEIAINLGRNLNGYIDKTMPWKLTNNLNRLSQILHILLNGIYAMSTMLSIVIPKKTKEILELLQISNYSFDLIDDFFKFNNKQFKKLDYPLFKKY